MTKPQVRVVRILVYEGDEEFIRSSLGEQRHVKGKISHGNGTITEGYLSGDVGNMTFVEPEVKHPLIGTQVTMKVSRVVETPLTDAELAQKHDCYKDGDADIPQVICDRNGQVALSLCKKCGMAEVELLGTICSGDYKKLPRLP